MTDVNTIVGDPIKAADGSVILTVSKVSFGFVAGSEFGKSRTFRPSSIWRSGGGVSINPVAFLVINGDGVKVLHLDKQTHVIDKIIELAPQAVDKVKEMMDKRKEDDPEFQFNE